MVYDNLARSVMNFHLGAIYEPISSSVESSHRRGYENIEFLFDQKAQSSI